MDATDARLLAGRALAAAGEIERAKARCSAWPPTPAAAARCGCATPPSASCAASARASRPRPPGRAPTATSSPSASASIAELVPSGTRTSRSRAALFLSEKTVQNALTRVYAKLGVRSRTQLARALAPGRKRDGSARPMLVVI